jgi:hypothetical protein
MHLHAFKYLPVGRYFTTKSSGENREESAGVVLSYSILLQHCVAASIIL